MNNVVRLIFNENFEEKRGLWVSWTAHWTHQKEHHSHKTHFKKKKKKQTNTRRRVIIGIQTDTQSSVSWVLDSHSPPKYNFEPWTSPSYIRFFFFLNLFMRNKYTHTQGRKKWILIQKHTTIQFWTLNLTFI